MLGTESSSAGVTGARNHRAVFLAPGVSVYMMCLIWKFTHTPSYSIFTGEKNGSWKIKDVSGATHAMSGLAVVSFLMAWVSKVNRGGKEGDVPDCTQDRQLRGGGGVGAAR